MKLTNELLVFNKNFKASNEFYEFMQIEMLFHQFLIAPLKKDKNKKRSTNQCDYITSETDCADYASCYWYYGECYN